jgi:hypothetical protein
MLSKKASLLWEGSLGFDGTLDFGITGGIEQDVTKQTSEPGKIVGRVVDEVGRQIMEIRLTGTLAEPRYQLLPFAGIKKIFKKLTEPF